MAGSPDREEGDRDEPELARTRDHGVSLREAAGFGQPRHGGQQPSAGLRGRRRDAGRRRQRHRRGRGHPVLPDRGGADDDRHRRRRHRAYPHARWGAPDHRCDEHGAHGWPARHVQAGAQWRAGELRDHRPRKCRRRAVDRRRRLGHRLVRDAAPLGHDEPGRRDATGDPPRQPRFSRDPLPARVHHRRRAGPCVAERDFGDAAARWQPAEGRHPAGPGRLRRDPAPDRQGWRRRPAWRAHRRCGGSLRPGQWRRAVARGFRHVQIQGARADPRLLSRLGDHRPAPTGGLRRAHDPDVEHPGSVRRARHGLRLARPGASDGRGAEDRLRRPRRGLWRS